MIKEPYDKLIMVKTETKLVTPNDEGNKGEVSEKVVEVEAESATKRKEERQQQLQEKHQRLKQDHE